MGQEFPSWLCVVISTRFFELAPFHYTPVSIKEDRYKAKSPV